MKLDTLDLWTIAVMVFLILAFVYASAIHKDILIDILENNLEMQQK